MHKTSIILNAAPNIQEYLAASIDNIRRFTERGAYELIVVEHGGSLKQKEWLADQTDILTLFHDSPLTEGQVWNRGIEMSSGNSVLLLHSDTLVTEYWLDYMIQSLYQNEDIAGVGPLSNHAIGDQVIEVNYDSMEGMLQFGRNCNRSFGLKQQVTLSGFCLFLKRDVIDSIGSFHEQLQGQELTVDYCLRIAQVKYRLMVCTNVFVHHYGVDNSSELSSENIFKSLWGFCATELQPFPELVSMLPSSISNSSRLLLFGSGNGGTLLTLKGGFPELELHIVENNKVARVTSQRLNFDSIKISESLSDYDGEQDSFDYILLNTFSDVKETLRHCERLLKKDGKLIICLPNVYHYSTILSLVNGTELEERNITSWSISSFVSLLENTNFQVKTAEAVRVSMSEKETELINGLTRSNSNQLTEYSDISRFWIIASKVPSIAKIQEDFDQLFQSPSEELVEQILQSSSGTILKAAKSYNGPIIPLLNYLALSYYERNEMREVFPLLSAAYELNPEDPTTLCNLGTVYYGVGDNEKALHWLESIQARSEQVESWISKIQSEISQRNDLIKQIKLSLLRIEHNVDRQGSMGKLEEIINREDADFIMNEIREFVESSILDKNNTLQFLMSYFYKREIWGVALNMTEILLGYTKDDKILTFAGFLMVKLSRFKDALSYLKEVKHPDSQTLSLIRNLELNN
ncbi:methyltransferase domain-containing protein [Paenibacillus massiliensis]|uniref:methyltransferase domain-containing protein n=1 Tax=Paenibacillus massiliensis TaxID=225917 RepID=UPI0003AA1648|nr:methyltransferase domain-containing protein [Paenibacillus massiliensis]